MRGNLVFHSCLVLSVAFCVGCSKHPTDQQIQSDIQTKVAADPEVKDSNVAVVAKEGKVTLSGKVKTADAEKKLQQIAKEEPGVSDVVDQTAVDPNLTAEAVPAPMQPPMNVQPEPAAAPPPPPPPPPQPVVVPAGTVLTVRLVQSLSSKTSQAGGTFSATMANPITIDGKTVIPQGSKAFGIVRDAKKAGKFKGGAVLSLGLTSIIVDGQHYNIATDNASQETKGKGKRTAGLMVGGAGGGAAIGGLAGGGKGAAIGALAGVTAGAIGAGASGNNRDIELPSESALTFALTQRLTLKP
ncbi:MAG: BON domain-containing protein [Terracidiphilus sp.]